MNIGLFFGSFNPIHVGHLIIAQHLLNETSLDKIWLVVSPHNPLKEKSTLAHDQDRLQMVRLAVEDHPKIWVSDIEFKLPRPSFTIDTLAHLEEKYPNDNFSLIMGGDNLISLPKWKNYDQILNKYSIYVYRRPGYDSSTDLASHHAIRFVDAPLLDISSTFIRNTLKAGKSVQFMVPEKALEELLTKKLYLKS
ncbi:MAG TPA: nicotinate (nicotinamide) nucleotide adenylyltransferase [Saprospiraceae bacterium]|nr:nicotinate (nicotinamide) nucleotide adenylyltransferase [Saprospiraceae bacterium]